MSLSLSLLLLESVSVSGVASMETAAIQSVA